MENKPRFLLDFYPQTALKLSSETQVAFLPFFLEIIVVYFDFPLFVHFEPKVSLLIFPEVLKVVHASSKALLKSFMLNCGDFYKPQKAQFIPTFCKRINRTSNSSRELVTAFEERDERLIHATKFIYNNNKHGFFHQME